MKTSDGGKSGEFFFYSQDDMFIIKSMSKDELAAFQKRSESYF